MILMLKDIENLNNTVKNVFVEYGLECDINFHGGRGVGGRSAPTPLADAWIWEQAC